MVLNLKSMTGVLAALALTGGLSVTGALAQDAEEASGEAVQEEQAADTIETAEEEFVQSEVARRSNSCEEYSRESAGWTLMVAADHDPRHTPCVTDQGSRIRRR